MPQLSALSSRSLTSAGHRTLSGLSWSVATGDSTADQLQDLQFGNGRYVAVGGTTILTSTDGVNWTRVIPPAPNAIDRDLYVVAYGAGLWVTMGTGSGVTGYWTSSDGVSWIKRGLLAEGGQQPRLDLVFVNNQFVLSGDDLEIHTSSDGLTFTARLQGGVSFGVAGQIAYIPSVGRHLFPENNRIYISDNNALTWSQPSTFQISQLQVALAMAYTGTKLLVIGWRFDSTYIPAVAESTDNGATWTVINNNLQLPFARLTYDNGTFIATDRARISVSTDGIVWSAPELLPGASGTNFSYSKPRYINGSWFIAGRASSNTIIWTTAPRFSYFRGTTELTTDVTLSHYNSIDEVLTSSVSRWGRASMTVPKVTATPYPYIETAIDTIGTDNWIFDCWILTDATTVTNREPLHLFTIATADLSQYVGIYINPSFGSLNWNFVVRSKNTTPGAAGSGTSAPVPAVGNQWFHFAFVKNNLEVKAYINGVGTFPTGNHRWGTGYSRIQIGRVEGLFASGAVNIDNAHLSLGLNRLGITSSTLPDTITVPTSEGTATASTVWYSLLG